MKPALAVQTLMPVLKLNAGKIKREKHFETFYCPFGRLHAKRIYLFSDKEPRNDCSSENSHKHIKCSNGAPSRLKIWIIRFHICSITIWPHNSSSQFHVIKYTSCDGCCRLMWCDVLEKLLFLFSTPIYLSIRPTQLYQSRRIIKKKNIKKSVCECLSIAF